jgi:hypothetical protein
MHGPVGVGPPRATGLSYVITFFLGIAIGLAIARGWNFPG